jgi:hypothetical protein
MAPPSTAPVDWAAWGRFERAEGTFAPAFVLPSDFSGTTTHDGMSVAVSSVDETRKTPSGPQLYRNFEVRAAGVVIAYDGAHDRAQAWVAVGSGNAKGIASVDLGGPAKAEHFRVLLLLPVFPPEPQLATSPDADRRSTTFTLTWQTPASRRSVVYRAGQHELIAMAARRGIPTSWQADDPPAERSAAARAVACCYATRSNRSQSCSMRAPRPTPTPSAVICGPSPSTPSSGTPLCWSPARGRPPPMGSSPSACRRSLNHLLRW